MENPVLVYFNLTPEEWQTAFEKDNHFITPCYEDISFNFTDKDIKDIEQEYDLISDEISCTDFRNQYMVQRENANVTAIASTIMLVTTLLFLFQINKTIMTTKFVVHGKELSIKRVNGKSNFQLYYKTCIAEIGMFAVSLVTALLVLHRPDIYYIPLKFKIGGSVIIFVMMAVSFIVELKRICIKNASKMIKGGMI